MHMSEKEIWTALHGMVFGAGFLLLFSGGFFAIRNLRAEYFSEAGLRQHLRRLTITIWIMVLLAWITVVVGTYWSYPWYRVKAPASVTGAALVAYPKFYLLSNSRTKDWHEFGMEWKEHVAWLAPIAITMVAYVTAKYGRALVRPRQLRTAVLAFALVAFVATGVAGAFGAFLNKYAPVRGGPEIQLLGPAQVNGD